MPPGPIRALRYIHEAIRAQAALVEERCASAQPADVAGFRDQIATLTRAVRLHVAGEDAGMFPVLAERIPNSVASFEFDHVSEEERLAELDRLGQQCAGDDDLQELRRSAIVVREHLDLHMTKEEQILWPLTEEHFAPPEQATIVQKILAAIPKEEFPTLLPWIVDMVTVDDAVAYVQFLEKVQPAEVFAMTARWLSDGVSAERLAALRPRLPALA